MLSGLPSGYQAYVSLGLIFVSGLLIGLAAKKAVVSAVLFVVGVAVASFAGITAFNSYEKAVITHFPLILASAYSHFGASLAGYPVLFLLGLGIGIWKG